ncbi:M15 family metallopeptidase [Xanthobacter sp. V3C-3]|uniref:M15 family metallopeptidase n=1 Tax=Xanthobacter lutulentifluminis TaxID=3119935 RepID=UPI0037292FAB
MAETIGDYLVKLGLHVDKAQEQRFNSSLNNLSKTLTAMAAGLAAAATAIQATVVAVSKSFDNLYFAAQRTGSTVAGIKALSYAFGQIGSSGNEAQSALEGLAKAMRTNPGIGKWLNSQGIATEGRKTEEVLGDIFEQFKKKPYYIGAQFAQLAGISEDTFNKASQQWDQVKKFVKEYEETQRKFGVDPDRAAKSSNELMTAFRGLMANVDALLTKIVVALQPQLTQILKDIGDWFQRHQDQIVRILDQILAAVQGLVSDIIALGRALQPVVEKFVEMVEALTGKNGLEAALLVVTAGALAAFVAKWAIFFGMLAKYAPLIAVLTAMGWDMFFATDQEKLEIGGKVNDAINGKASDPDNWWTRSQNAVRRTFGMPEVDNKGQPRASGGGGGGGSGSAPPPGLTKVTTKSGKTAWVPTAGAAQFQGFLNDYEAAGGNIDDLQGFNDRDIRGMPGVKSAHGREGAIDINPAPSNPFDVTRPMIPETAELAKKWGLGWGGNWSSRKDWGHFSLRPGEGGGLMDPDKLKALQEEQRERLKDKQSELFGGTPLGAGGTRMASLSNRTNITIYGSSDPAGTGANLSGAQNRLASDLIRNAQSAFV